MAAALQDRAVVIRLTDFSEASQIVSFFTQKNGLTRVIAKGIKRGTKKRFETGVDLLELGELGYAPARGAAELGNLTSWLQLDTFQGLRRELPRLYGGLYVAELLGALTEDGDPDETLFRSTVETLLTLAQGQNVIGCMVKYQISLLSCIGYVPQMDRCMDCQRPRVAGAPAYFSSSAGGLICRDCEPHHVEKRSAPNATPASAESDLEMLSLYDYHLRQIAGRGFKAADQFFSILPTG